jgi:hypothetical protein
MGSTTFCSKASVGYPDNDIEAHLERKVHENVLKKVFHARINESLTHYKAAVMGETTS